jgi:hypothetical protein
MKRVKSKSEKIEAYAADVEILIHLYPGVFQIKL